MTPLPATQQQPVTAGRTAAGSSDLNAPPRGSSGHQGPAPVPCRSGKDHDKREPSPERAVWIQGRGQRQDAKTQVIPCVQEARAEKEGGR